MASKTVTLDITEKELTALVKGAAGAFGYRFYHPYLSIHSEKGFPDCTMVKELGDGGTRLLFAELKSEKGKPTEKQLEWLDLLRRVREVGVYLWKPSDWGEIEGVLRRK